LEVDRNPFMLASYPLFVAVRRDATIIAAK
jgi:hypothetical protein